MPHIPVHCGVKTPEVKQQVARTHHVGREAALLWEPLTAAGPNPSETGSWGS